MYPGFMPKEPMIKKLTKQLEDLILEKSNAAFIVGAIRYARGDPV
jgi:hypothetical protein